MLNWLTNTLVYYGISFNTTDLAGDPYLNFFLSIIVELIAIIASHITLERYGRKIPYSVNMGLTGIALLFILFVPKGKIRKNKKEKKIFLRNFIKNLRHGIYGHCFSLNRQIYHFVYI